MADFDLNEIKKYTGLVIKTLDEKKAVDIKVIDISNVSVMADYFVIASGNNRNQIQMLSDEIDSRLSKEGLNCRQIEGYESASWVLMDFGDIIVHIFDKENRLFYDLERIWCDGKETDLAEFTNLVSEN